MLCSRQQNVQEVWPDEIIVAQLKENSRKQEVGEEIKNPYDIMVDNGYIVTVVGVQDTLSKSEVEADAEFDYHDI